MEGNKNSASIPNNWPARVLNSTAGSLRCGKRFRTTSLKTTGLAVRRTWERSSCNEMEHLNVVLKPNQQFQLRFLLQGRHRTPLCVSGSQSLRSSFSLERHDQKTARPVTLAIPLADKRYQHLLFLQLPFINQIAVSEISRRDTSYLLHKLATSWTGGLTTGGPGVVTLACDLLNVAADCPHCWNLAFRFFHQSVDGTKYLVNVIMIGISWFVRGSDWTITGHLVSQKKSLHRL